MTEVVKQSLSGRAKRGGLWVLLGKFFESGVRLGSNILLSWLLFREAFGVLVPVNVFLTGIQLFSDVGIGPSIVRSKRGEDSSFLRTVWTVQVIRGFMLYAACWLFAGPYSRFVGELVTEGGMREQEMIASLLVVAGMSAMFLGFRSPSWFTLDRQIAQGRKTLIQAISQVCSVATMVTWAWVSPTPMALVAGTVVNSICQAILSHTLLPGVSMRFRFEKEALQELYLFGRWIFLSTALVFFAMQFERILITQLLDTAQTGDFGIAFGLAVMVPTFLTALSTSLVFPIWMESFRRKDHHHAGRVQRSRRGVLSLGIAGLVCVVTMAPAFFSLLYREDYQGAAIIAQLLCVPFWFALLLGSCSKVALVYGDSRSVSGANLAVLVVKLPACWFGFQWLGLPGFVVGMAIGNLAGVLRLHQRLAAHDAHLFKQDVFLSLTYLGFGVAGYYLSGFAATLAVLPGLLVVGAYCAIVVAVLLQPARSLFQKKTA